MCGRPSVDGGYCEGFLSGEGPCTSEPDPQLVIDVDTSLMPLLNDIIDRHIARRGREILNVAHDLGDEAAGHEAVWQVNAMRSIPTDQGDVNL
jgi:hypothetical protein